MTAGGVAFEQLHDKQANEHRGIQRTAPPLMAYLATLLKDRRCVELCEQFVLDPP